MTPGCTIPHVEVSSRVLWVENAQQLERVCQQAAAAGAVAVDTEADSFHSYFAKICLVQLSFDDQHVLIDPLRLSREEMAPLAQLLANPHLPKVLHGADYDQRMIQKDLGVRLRALADTQAAAQVLGEKQTSLAALLAKELGVQLDKSQQRADWARRPLPEAMMAYAVDDTRYLQALLARLLVRLERLGRRHWWEEECQALEEVTYEPPVPDPWAFLRVKGTRALSAEALGRLAAVWELRDAIARELDVPAFRVIPSECLVRLAANPPEDLPALAAVGGIPQRVLRRWGRELLRILARAQPLAPPKKPSTIPDTSQQKLLTELRRVRDHLAEELGLDPGFLAPRWALEAVAQQRPASLDAWLSCLRRRWRVELLREPLSEVLAQG